MIKKVEPTNPDVNPRKQGDEDETPRTGQSSTDIRKANDNIRKSQGDDAGHRPTIDRDR